MGHSLELTAPSRRRNWDHPLRSAGGGWASVKEEGTPSLPASPLTHLPPPRSTPVPVRVLKKTGLVEETGGTSQ